MDRKVNISISELLKDAQSALNGKWGTILGAFALYLIISIVAGIIPFLSFIIEGPLNLGLTMIALNIIRNKSVEVGLLFEGFKNFGSALGLLVLTAIAVFVGLIFFIIPGIILALGLSQVFYILADNPNMPIIDVMKKSYEMMKGYKTKYFLLGVVFALLSIASLLTLGLAFIWLIPVMAVASAKFYTLINKDEKEGLEIEDNLIL